MGALTRGTGNMGALTRGTGNMGALTRGTGISAKSVGKINVISA
jgi:hypothetical protein